MKGLCRSEVLSTNLRHWLSVSKKNNNNKKNSILLIIYSETFQSFCPSTVKPTLVLFYRL